MPLVILGRLLRKYCSSSEVQTVCFYTERMRVLWKGEDWCGSDLFFEDGKGGLFVGTPFPNCIDFGKIKDRPSMMGEILNKPLVEVSEAQEQLHLILVGWNRSFGNSSYFDRIHVDEIVRDDNPKILYLCVLELAFMWFKEKVVDVK